MKERSRRPLEGNESIPAFSPATNFNPDFLENIGEWHMYRRGSVLLGQGEEPAYVGLVRSGIMKLTFSDEDGEEQTLGLRSTGWWMNGKLAYLGLQSLAQVTAVTECEVSLLKVKQFLQLVEEDRNVARHFLAAQCRELVTVQQHAIMRGKSAEERLAHLLGENSTAIWAPVDPSLVMRQSDIASLLGITPEHLSRLRNRRAIQARKNI